MIMTIYFSAIDTLTAMPGLSIAPRPFELLGMARHHIVLCETQ